jgi:hypothetical protein
MLSELVLPGSGHLILGDRARGIGFLSISVPLLAVGQGLIWSAYLLPNHGSASPLVLGEYPFGHDDFYADRLWMVGLGSILDAAGRAVSAYSAWTAMTAYLGRERYEGGGETDLPPDAQDIGELLAAPFLPANFLAPEVAAPVLLLNVPLLAPENLEACSNFFSRPSEPFWGRDYPPASALALKFLTSAVSAYADALAREIFFRGYISGQDGRVASSLFSSSSYLLSSAVSGDRAWSFALDGITEFCYGWYSSGLAAGEGGRLGKSIALRFWCELTGSMGRYLRDPAGDGPVGFGISLYY